MSFEQRDWSLVDIERLDMVDVLGGSICYKMRDNKIYRVLGLSNKYLNENWLTDFSRFYYDLLDKNRLLYPILRLYFQIKIEYKINIICSWDFCIYYILFIFFYYGIKKYSNLNIFFGNLLDILSIVHIKIFFSSLGVGNFWIDNFSSFNIIDSYNDFIFNNFLIEFDLRNFFFFIGINLRIEYPLIFCRLRRNYIKKKGNLYLYLLGVDNNYMALPIKKVGTNINILYKLIQGKHKICIKLLKDNIKCLFISSYNFLLKNYKILKILKLLMFFLNHKKKNNNFNFYCLNNNLSCINSQQSGITFKKSNKLLENFNKVYKNILLNKNKIINYLVGLDDLDILKNINKFIIYQGSFNDISSFYSDLVVSTVSFIEKDVISSNLLGILQYGSIVIDNIYVLTDEMIMILLNKSKILLYNKGNNIIFLKYYINFLNIEIFYNSFFFFEYCNKRMYLFLFVLNKRFFFKDYILFFIFYKKIKQIYYYIYFFYIIINSIFFHFLVLKSFFKFSLNLLVMKKKFKFNFFSNYKKEKIKLKKNFCLNNFFLNWKEFFLIFKFNFNKNSKYNLIYNNFELLLLQNSKNNNIKNFEDIKQDNFNRLIW